VKWGYVAVLLLVGLAGVAFALYAGDRGVKVWSRARRRRVMKARLAAAARRAEQQQEQRQSAANASVALTSLMPAIKRPPLTTPGGRAPSRPKKRPGRTGPQDRVTAPGRKVIHTGEHPRTTRNTDKPADR
jgi:Flp pilus assembly protein TadB